MVDRAMFFTAENNKQTVTEVKTYLSTQLPWTFELLDDHVPSQFLRGDVHKNGTCHLMFTTDAQLEFLTNVKTWYVDATFKVIKQPFTQLFSIHAFVKQDGELMQCKLHSLSSSCRVVKTIQARVPCSYRRASTSTTRTSRCVRL